MGLRREVNYTADLVAEVAAVQRLHDQELGQLAMIASFDAARRIRAQREAQQAIAKIEQRLDSLETALAEQLPQVGEYATAEPEATVEEEFDAAISEGRAVRFLYTDREGRNSVRILSPYEVKGVGGRELVVGYDHEREGIRQFDLSRVELVGPVGEVEYREPVE